MPTKYKKIRTRMKCLFRQQICYEAENKILPGLWAGLTYYEPLFIYTPEKGTAVYYDFTSYFQDPTVGTIYLERNKEKFWEIVKLFEEDLKKLEEMIKTEEAEFKQLYERLISFWSKLAVFMAIGGIRKNLVSEELSEKAYALRIGTDKIIYEAVEQMIKKVERILPPEYKPYLELMTYDEIANKNAEIEELKKRMAGYIFFKGIIYSEENIENFLAKNDISLVKENYEILGGEIACRGIASGKARIILEFSQLENLEAGDIIITPMTTPDFIPYLEKVSGIVTDEGGITCHAAIIARELNIPTLVGTGIATRVLKDNDLIELNADLGIISLID